MDRRSWRADRAARTEHQARQLDHHRDRRGAFDRSRHHSVASAVAAQVASPEIRNEIEAIASTEQRFPYPFGEPLRARKV
jgi:hypothetical protein